MTRRSSTYLTKAERAANHLLGTLTGLLDLALAESQRLTLEHPVRVADVTATAIESFDTDLHGRKAFRSTTLMPGSRRSRFDCWEIRSASSRSCMN